MPLALRGIVLQSLTAIHHRKICNNTGISIRNPLTIRLTSGFIFHHPSSTTALHHHAQLPYPPSLNRVSILYASKPAQMTRYHQLSLCTSDNRSAKNQMQPAHSWCELLPQSLLNGSFQKTDDELPSMISDRCM